MNYPKVVWFDFIKIDQSLHRLPRIIHKSLRFGDDKTSFFYSGQFVNNPEADIVPGFFVFFARVPQADNHNHGNYILSHLLALRDESGYNNESMRSFLFFIWEIAKIVIIALLIVVPIRYFVFQPFFVRGQSMEPNFYHGDYLIIDELSYQFREPQRGEVIVFRYPHDPSQRYIKRIIGLPEETITIKDGQVLIFEDGIPQVLDETEYLSSSLQTLGDMEVKLDEDEYFVLGDNRPLSADSRRWGNLPEENIIGRVFFRAWPFVALAKIEVPAY